MVGQAFVSCPQSWSAACSPWRSWESVWANSSNARRSAATRSSSMSTTSKSPSCRRYSARIFSIRPPSARRDQPGAQERAHLALPPPDLRCVEQIFAQDLRAELARREGEHDDADERQQEVVHVHRAEEACAHPLAQEPADGGHHVRDRPVALDLLGKVARQVVVL